MQKPSFLLKLITITMSLAVIVFSIALLSLYSTVNEIKNEKHISSSSDQLITDAVELNNKIIDINNKIDDLDKKLDEYKDGTSSNDSSIKKELQNIKKELNTLNSTNVNKNNNGSGTHTSGSVSEIDQLKNKISILQDKVSQQATDIEALQSATSNQVVGAIVAYGGSSLPTDYLECNGQAVSRSDYADLFSVIGTTYGVGDGSTTFNLPNLQDKFPMASSSKTLGTFITPGLPNITGSIFEPPYPVNPTNQGITTLTGAFKSSVKGSSNGWTDGGSGRVPANTKNFSAADGEVHNVGGVDTYRNDIYGKSETVQPPALVIKYIIKAK